MSITYGSQGVSVTPATDLYNRLATALTNAGWAQTSDSPVAAVSFNSVGPVGVWHPSYGTDFFVAIEYDDTNARLRIRAGETWNTGTHTLSAAVMVGSSATAADSTAVTPAADGHNPSADNANAGGITNYSTISTPGAGYSYLFEARDHLLIVGTRTTTNFYCVVGFYEPLATAITDDHPLILIEHPTQKYAGTHAVSNVNQINGIASRALGYGAVSTTGAFCVMVNGLATPTHLNSSSLPDHNEWSGGFNAATPSIYHQGAVATQAVIHGDASNAIAADRAFRGYLPDFVCTIQQGISTTEPAIGETFIVDGVQYYFLGYVAHGSTAFVQHKTQILAVKA